MDRLRGELAEFVADVFGSFPRRDQQRWGECYLRGLMLDGRRKSIQPMAERLPDGNMQALQQFVNQSPWDPLPVRRRIAERLSGVVRPEVWVIDDVSFPKCGKASIGVARQYCGAVGARLVLVYPPAIGLPSHTLRNLARQLAVRRREISIRRQ